MIDWPLDDEYLVVVPAYKRPKSLKRLLDSLAEAQKCSFEFNILVSFDGGSSKEAVDLVLKYKNIIPNLDIKTHEKNLGLKRHILSIGDLTATYENIIILEDDLYVDKYFFWYVVDSLKKFKKGKNICGISLYSLHFNEYINLPFSPDCSEQTAHYLMQIPCSWGQVFNRRHWAEFKEYLISHQGEMLSYDLPDYVKKWSSESWKKLYFDFMVRENKYFLYPCRSFATNTSEEGGHHNANGINFVQVPIFHEKYRCIESVDTSKLLKYDAYHELVPLEELRTTLGVDNVQFDIYGTKPEHILLKTKYVVSAKFNKSAVKCYPLDFKPLILNFEFPSYEDVNGLYLIETKHYISKNKGFFDIVLINKLASYFSYFNLNSKKHLFARILKIFDK